MEDFDKSDDEKLLESRAEEYLQCLTVNKDRLEQLLDIDVRMKQTKLQKVSQEVETLTAFKKFQEKQREALIKLKLGE